MTYVKSAGKHIRIVPVLRPLEDMPKTLSEATKEVEDALAPLPDGYWVEASVDGSECILVASESLGFIISPLSIRDGRHVEDAKSMFPHLVMASPVRGSA